MRTGLGLDIHPLKEGRALILGGVEIAHETGLWGHSDADVLAHAVCDSLLGAAALGDLGAHFPDSDSRYKDISGLTLLGACAEKLRQAGYEIINIDATLAAERPKIAPYAPQMCARMAAALGIGAGQISVKATTAEGLGFIGKAEGMAALAVCLIETAG